MNDAYNFDITRENVAVVNAKTIKIDKQIQELYDFIHRLCEENDKLKKVIEILQEKIKLNTYYLSLVEYDDGLTIEQYNLLKEVLGND